MNSLAKSGGGFAAVNDGKVIAAVNPPVAGLIADGPCRQVVAEPDRFEKAICSQLGFPSEMELVVGDIIVLQSTPFQAAITDRGLTDTRSCKVVPSFSRVTKS